MCFIPGTIRLRAKKGKGKNAFAIVRLSSDCQAASVTIITDDHCTGYSHAGHPERPQRVGETLNLLRTQTDLSISWAAPASVEDAVIFRAHNPHVVARLFVEEHFDGDTPYYENIANYARQSVGGALEAMRRARRGEMTFSLFRPPGHHATRSRSMGFCYLNNIAIATLAALADGERRVAVFDFDVHHGNGTENILLNHPGAAFYSVHQHPAYPDTGAENVGDNCFNFPVPPDTPRAEYRRTLESALDSLQSFKPSLVAVSAGFDAYARDPLASGTLEMEDFHALGKSIRAIGVPVFSVLEGGYSSRLPELVFAYLKGLVGK